MNARQPECVVISAPKIHCSSYVSNILCSCQLFVKGGSADVSTTRKSGLAGQGGQLAGHHQRICHVNHNGGGFDRTGLHVWQGSLLLASFLADPIGGARNLLSCVMRNLPSVIRPPGSEAIFMGSMRGYELPTSLHYPIEGVALERPCKGGITRNHGTEKGRIESHEMKIYSGARGVQDCGCKSKIVGQLPQYTPDANGGPTHVRFRPNKYLNVFCPDVAWQGETILELGAGTGVCGMTAALALGCPVLLTDRLEDVLDNLRHNAVLNGLEHMVRVARVEWGAPENGGLPQEVRERAPFKVRDEQTRVSESSAFWIAPSPCCYDCALLHGTMLLCRLLFT